MNVGFNGGSWRYIKEVYVYECFNMHLYIVYNVYIVLWLLVIYREVMKIMKLKLIVFDNNIIIIILCFCLKILRFYYSIILYIC